MVSGTLRRAPSGGPLPRVGQLHNLPEGQVYSVRRTLEAPSRYSFWWRLAEAACIYRYIYETHRRDVSIHTGMAGKEWDR